MKTTTVVAIGLVGLVAVIVYTQRAQLGIDPAANRRMLIGSLPRELTAAEIKAATQPTLVQSTAQGAQLGSVGGIYGAAGGAAVGFFKGLLD